MYKRQGWIRPRLATTVPIAPTAAAAGGPLPAGRWELHVAVSVAGFSRMTPVLRRGEPLVLTTFAPGRIRVGAEAPPPPDLPLRIYRRLPGPVMSTVWRTRHARSLTTVRRRWARAAAAARR